MRQYLYYGVTVQSNLLLCIKSLQSFMFQPYYSWQKRPDRLICISNVLSNCLPVFSLLPIEITKEKEMKSLIIIIGKPSFCQGQMRGKADSLRPSALIFALNFKYLGYGFSLNTMINCETQLALKDKISMLGHNLSNWFGCFYLFSPSGQ